MINHISSWAEQVIISMIIATILEMILPKGNTKKYIKTIIGIYILYTIISPVITFATGSELKIDYSEYEEYFSNSEEYKTLESEFNDITTKSIEDTYQEEIENQLRKDIEEMGFIVNNISLEINLETLEIKEINLSLDKTIKDKEVSDNTTNISINKIEIGNTMTKSEKNTLSRQEIEKIKKNLEENYGVVYDSIVINSI